MTVLTPDIRRVCDRPSQILNVANVNGSRSITEVLSNLLGEVVGVEAKAFLDPKDALARLAPNTIELFPIACDLLKLTGTRVINWLRAMPVCRSVPIIMITGHHAHAIRCRRLGPLCSDVLETQTPRQWNPSTSPRSVLSQPELINR